MKKMLRITNHQGNSNQNHNALSLHYNNTTVEKTKVTNVGKDMEKRESLHNIDENVNSTIIYYLVTLAVWMRLKHLKVEGTTIGFTNPTTEYICRGN
jgi:hypothetical protein